MLNYLLIQALAAISYKQVKRVKEPMYDLTERVERDDVRNVIQSLGFGVALERNPRSIPVASAEQAAEYWRARTEEELESAGLPKGEGTTSHTQNAQQQKVRQANIVAARMQRMSNVSMALVIRKRGASHMTSNLNNQEITNTSASSSRKKGQ